jgi:ATP-dependent DNA ligase
MRPSDTTRRDGYVPPCIPTRAYKAPSGPGWVHEIKHDGYRLQVRRDGDTVRLFTRRGYDWSGRYPAIAVTAMLLRARSFTLDGEAVVCGPDGVAIFDALHRRGTVTEAMLYAFDLLELDGEDLRHIPLLDRKRRLARLLGGAGSASSSVTIPTKTAPRSSARPASWAWRASCQSAGPRLTGLAPPGTGSRSRIRTARR